MAPPLFFFLSIFIIIILSSFKQQPRFAIDDRRVSLWNPPGDTLFRAYGVGAIHDAFNTSQPAFRTAMAAMVCYFLVTFYVVRR